jgi:hypothetical protein
LKEQNKYDQVPSMVLDRLQRIMPLTDQVADEITCDGTDVLEHIHKVAKLSVKRGRWSSSGFGEIWRVLMIAARMSVGLGGPEATAKTDAELAKALEDFDRVVNVESLRLAKETGKHPLSLSSDSPFSVVS